MMTQAQNMYGGSTATMVNVQTKVAPPRHRKEVGGASSLSLFESVAWIIMSGGPMPASEPFKPTPVECTEQRASQSDHSQSYHEPVDSAPHEAEDAGDAHEEKEPKFPQCRGEHMEYRQGTNPPGKRRWRHVNPPESTTAKHETVKKRPNLAETPGLFRRVSC